MEAKDTVIGDFDLKWKLNNGDYHIDDLRRGAQAQAEISFKAGIKEVVEWIIRNYWTGLGAYNIPLEDWQAKLKEWGL